MEESELLNWVIVFIIAFVSFFIARRKDRLLKKEEKERREGTE
jgi:hypothetical protein